MGFKLWHLSSKGHLYIISIKLNNLVIYNKKYEKQTTIQKEVWL